MDPIDKEHSILSSTFQSDTDVQENILRPKSLRDLQGQRRIKDNLSVFIQAALERKETLDHVFLIGPPGLGKTTLASIIATKWAPRSAWTSAPALEKPKDLAGILDECHRRKYLFS